MKTDPATCISRRHFVKTVVLGTAATYCSSASLPLANQASDGGAPHVERTSEDFSVCHRVRDGESLPLPPVSREVEFVVVGGGPSGLVAAYRLRERNVLLLEKEPVVGGNARADYWDNMPYAAGSIAFYGVSPTVALHDELGLTAEPLTTARFDTIIDGQVLKGDLWGEELDQVLSRSDAHGVRAARNELLRVDGAKEKTRLDGMKLSDLLTNHGEDVKKFYDWLLAYFGGRTDEFSAYVGLLMARSQMGEGLGALYPEGVSKGGVFTFPGGLSEVAIALRNKIEAAGSSRVITEAAVYHVAQDNSGVNVSYMQHGKPFTVRGRAAIVAAPKFICKHIVRNIPSDQLEAMARMRYVPYLVGAVAVNGNLTPEVRAARVLNGPICSMRDCSADKSKQLYRIEIPIRPEKRFQLLGNEFFGELSDEVVTFFDHIFPGAKRKIAEVRFWRRGHNWYVPVPNMVTKIQPVASRTFGRIHFANADSLGPISEFGWAMLAADTAVSAVTQRSAAEIARSRVSIQ